MRIAGRPFNELQRICLSRSRANGQRDASNKPESRPSTDTPPGYLSSSLEQASPIGRRGATSYHAMTNPALPRSDRCCGRIGLLDLACLSSTSAMRYHQRGQRTDADQEREFSKSMDPFGVMREEKRCPSQKARAGRTKRSRSLRSASKFAYSAQSTGMIWPFKRFTIIAARGSTA